jgi:adenine-specific DNA-methyltransferase
MYYHVTYIQKILFMQNLLNDLTVALSEDDRLVSDGILMKNRIVELALNLDPRLLKILINNESLKKNFFVEVEQILVFDKIKFQKFVSNKQFLPGSYTQFKNKIGLTINGDYVEDTENVVLAWPYRDCVLEGGQDIEDAKRDEVFWSETLSPDEIDRLLSPKALVNFKRFTSDSVDPKPVTLSDNENLIIKGNNLLALHTLRNRYAKKIDLIYIDPPYNPDSKSNTFCYNNKFNRSTWLTFIKNRLDIARDLLKENGSLVIAIDENEQCHLGVLLKEMFTEHEVHCITIVHNPRGVQGTNFSYTHEYAFFVIPKGRKTIGNRIVDESDVDWRNLRDNGGESERSDAKNCFYGIIVEDNKIVGFTDVVPTGIDPESQNVEGPALGQTTIYPIDPSGIQRKWRYARQSIEEVMHLLRAKKTKGRFEIELGKNFGTYRTVWQDPRYDANEYGTKLIKSLVTDCEFAFPKSLWNVYDCIYAIVGNKKDAIVLDFFGGSGTTAHAVLELNKNDGGNRKFILTEQMHYVEKVTAPRVHQVMINNGSDSFVYCEIAKANETFVDLVMQAKDSNKLSEVWNEMQDRAFLSYKIDVKDINASQTEFKALTLEEQKQFLIEVLDKNLLYVPYSEIEDESYQIGEADRVLNSHFSSK